MQHIDYPLVAKTHPPMYLMHKYWARKPHNVVAEYIKRYSNEGDIVLDPFAGSGVTAIEALKSNRKAVAIDLDPIATFITLMTAIPIDIDKFTYSFKKIEVKVKDKIHSLYETKCEKCGVGTFIEASICQDNNLSELRYHCTCQKGTLWKKPDDDDLIKFQEIENMNIPYWYPKNELIHNSRVNVHRGEKVYELFTKRNLLALSMLYEEIKQIEDKEIKELLKFTFSSALPQASKLVFVYRIKGREKQVGGWATRGYWIPPEYFEINAWNCFEERFNKIKRGKKESNSLIKNYKTAKVFDDLKDDCNLLIKTHNVLNMSDIIPPNSIDYIFTDPPYGDAVPYLELDYMWNSWLDNEVDFNDEIIISDSPIRDKRFELYEKMLNAAFKQIHLVLKPEKYLTVTFHSTDIRIWNAIIKAVVWAGFDMEKIIYQPPARTSAKGLLAPYGSAVGDYYIRFKKPKTEKKIPTESEIDKKRYVTVVVETAKKIIAKRGEPVPYQHILNGIIPELDKNGVLLRGDKDVQDVMKEYLDKEFVLIDVKDDEGKITGKLWWLKNPSSIKINLVPLIERVEKTIINVLNRKIDASFDEILQDIFICFPNALTPETHNIIPILREYAEQSKGKWHLKPEVRARENQHSLMIGYLAEIGEKLGYSVWVGSPEQGGVYMGKPLSKLSVARLTLPLPSEKLDRIRNIDLLWIKDNQIEYEFEVENTTTITEAVVRGENIPYDSQRCIIIPEEREQLLLRKIEEPALKHLGIDKWRIMFYNDLEEYYNTIKRKKSLDFSEFKQLIRLPKDKGVRMDLGMFT